MTAVCRETLRYFRKLQLYGSADGITSFDATWNKCLVEDVLRIRDAAPWRKISRGA